MGCPPCGGHEVRWVEVVAQPLPGVPVVVMMTQPLPGVPVVRHRRRPPVRLLLPDRRGPRVSTVHSVVGAQGGASAAVASVSAGTSGSVGSRRIYGMRSLSWNALWNLREIRSGKLRAKVRGQISASMMKGPEALGASGCLARSWVRGCFAALTRTRSPT